jgi:NAD(P)-dependent dehydrogenase (short-subunit alcohol dehydrogenase family)
MNRTPESRVALVTGGNRGIGFEVCRQLADLGYVTILTARDAPKGEAAARSLRRPGRTVLFRQLDVTCAESIEAARDWTAARYEKLDALVNNAAILYDDWQRAVDADLDTAREAMETNLYGPWHVAQAFLPLLRASGRARVVNVSSGSGQLASMRGGTPAYAISKAALNALTRILAAELQRDRILVNAVCPGWVATDMGGGGRPIPEGAAGVVWAATLPSGGPTGGFFRDGKPLAW